MKKILFLLAMLPMGLFTACSSDGDDTDNAGTVDIQLESTDVSIPVNGEININVLGVNISDCIITEEEDFIVNVYSIGNKLNIEGSHVGKSKVFVSYKDKTAMCNVVVYPVNDFIGPTVTEFGISKDELKNYVEKPYDSYKQNGQTGTAEIVYTRTGYKITNSYYWDNDILCGVRKKILSDDNDTQMFLNISKSMSECMKLVSSSLTTVNSYPKGHRLISIYQFSGKYYAVYEQTKYESLYETGASLPTENVIYYAKDLETAKTHKFIR